MDITDDILKVAITKSVEAGLLPRRALKEDFQDAKEMMKTILECVFEQAESTQATVNCMDMDLEQSPVVQRATYFHA
jgi:hypothetical protein